MKANEQAILTFINSQEVLTTQDLMKEFGYKYQGARTIINKFYKEGFLEPLLERGTWGITEKGVRRLNDKRKG